MREDRLVRRAHVRLREMNIVTMDKPYRLRDIRDGCNGENKENERDKMVIFKKKNVADRSVEVLNSVV